MATLVDALERLARREEVVNRARAAIPVKVVVDQDQSAVHDLVEEVHQGREGRLVPVAVETKHGNGPLGAKAWQRVVEPTPMDGELPAGATKAFEVCDELVVVRRVAVVPEDVRLSSAQGPLAV